MEAPHSAQVHDIKAAIRYLRYFSDTFLFDSNRVGITEGSVEINACVNWYGVNDFTIPTEKAFTDEQLREFSNVIPEWAKNGMTYYLFDGKQEDQEVLRVVG